jgi:hypothetical protein
MQQNTTFDWPRAIELNRTALTRIVAELLAMIGVVSVAAVERILRPTESALRRLIVIAARGLVVKPSPKRAMPKGKVIVRKSAEKGRMAFRLFDQRKKFDFIPMPPANPHIVYVKTYESNPFNPFSSYYNWRKPKPVTATTTKHLSRRLAAVIHALENLPSQARRLVRWTARRKLMDRPKFTCVMRPGKAPGHRNEPTADVDFVLKECHWLARDALKQDSS